MSTSYVPQKSSTRFFVPRTLASDFDNFLNTDVPNMVMDFELITDWFRQFDDDYEKQYIRGEIYPDSAKSRYANTDNNLNFRASVSSGIKKGDMIIDLSGNIYLFDWNVLLEHNNAPTRALRCNAKLSFEKYHEDEADDDGYLLRKRGWDTFIDDLPVNAYYYDGRPEWTAMSMNPGTQANALTVVNLQLNRKTKDIRIDDRFVWSGSKYTIINVSYQGTDIDNKNGVITLQAKRTAGELH